MISVEKVTRGAISLLRGNTETEPCRTHNDNFVMAPKQDAIKSAPLTLSLQVHRIYTEAT